MKQMKSDHEFGMAVRLTFCLKKKNHSLDKCSTQDKNIMMTTEIAFFHNFIS